MAQFQKVGTEVYGNTPNNVYQRPYNPVAHESSVRVSPTNIWDAPSTSPIYNSTLLLFSPEGFKPSRSFFLSLLFFPFLCGYAHPVVCHKPPRTSVELSLQRRHKCRIRHTHNRDEYRQGQQHFRRHSKREVAIKQGIQRGPITTLPKWSMITARLQAYQLGVESSNGNSWGGQLVLCLTMASHTNPFPFQLPFLLLSLPDRNNLKFQHPELITKPGPTHDLKQVLDEPNNLRRKTSNQVGRQQRQERNQKPGRSHPNRWSKSFCIW